MTASSEDVAKIEAILLEGASIRRVIGLQVATAGSDLVDVRLCDDRVKDQHGVGGRGVNGPSPPPEGVGDVSGELPVPLDPDCGPLDSR